MGENNNITALFLTTCSFFFALHENTFTSEGVFSKMFTEQEQMPACIKSPANFLSRDRRNGCHSQKDLAV